MNNLVLFLHLHMSTEHLPPVTPLLRADGRNFIASLVNRCPSSFSFPSAFYGSLVQFLQEGPTWNSGGRVPIAKQFNRLTVALRFVQRRGTFQWGCLLYSFAQISIYTRLKVWRLFASAWMKWSVKKKIAARHHNLVPWHEWLKADRQIKSWLFNVVRISRICSQDSLRCWHILVYVLNFQKIRAALITRHYTASNNYLTMIYCSFLPNKQSLMYSVTTALWVTSYYKLLQNEYQCTRNLFSYMCRGYINLAVYFTDVTKCKAKIFIIHYYNDLAFPVLPFPHMPLLQ